MKVYLHPIRDAGAETTGHLRYALGNGERGTIPIEFVDPTTIGLAAPPPPPARESESEEEGVIEQTQAEAPHEKYADLAKAFYDGSTANAQRGDDASGGWNRRCLKAMGHPEYVNYPQPAATVADAQCIHDAISPEGSTAWAGTVEAIAYAQSYTP